MAWFIRHNFIIFNPDDGESDNVKDNIRVAPGNHLPPVDDDPSAVAD